MSKIVCFHAFRGGAGKTTILANLGIGLARLGKRVGIIDFDLKAPAMQAVLKIPAEEARLKINNCLMKKCDAKELAIDVSKRFGVETGGLFFVAASSDAEDIVRTIEEGYEASLLGRLTREMASVLSLDYVFLDTHSGIDEDVILSVAVSDIVVEVTRFDEQSLTGAQTSLQVIRKIGKKTYLLGNMAPRDAVDSGEGVLEERLKVSVISVIPFFDDVWAAQNDDVFILSHPDHHFSILVRELAERLLEREPLERRPEKDRTSDVSKEKLAQEYY